MLTTTQLDGMPCYRLAYACLGAGLMLNLLPFLVSTVGHVAVPPASLPHFDSQQRERHGLARFEPQVRLSALRPASLQEQALCKACMMTVPSRMADSFARC